MVISLRQYYDLVEKKKSEKEQIESTRNMTNISCEQCKNGRYIVDEAINMSLPPTKWGVCDKCGDRQVIPLFEGKIIK
jgi:hypothetical protein